MLDVESIVSEAIVCISLMADIYTVEVPLFAHIISEGSMALVRIATKVLIYSIFDVFDKKFNVCYDS